MVDDISGVVIDAATRDAVLAHLRAGLPNEACGLLATVDRDGARSVVRFYPGDNLDRSPTRYTMDPRQVMEAIDDLEGRGWDLGAIVHSHPRTPAVPSRTDIAEAYYAESLLLIASFAVEPPSLRAWRLRPDRPESPCLELPLTVTG